MSDLILPADKKFKKQVIITLLITLPCCFVMFYLFSEYILYLLNSYNGIILITKINHLLFWIAIAIAVISSSLATYLILRAVKIFKSKQFPPPGMRVIRDTKIYTGKRAKWVGCMFVATALFVLSVNLIMYYQHHVLNNLMAQIIQSGYLP